MKKLYIVMLMQLVPLILFAQRNFHRLSIGTGAGLTQNHGELKSSRSRRLLAINADYYLSPFLHGGLELQTGNIAGQDLSNNRYFNNSFKAMMATAKLHLGQFMEHNYNNKFSKSALKGIFLGAGAGVIKNNQTEIYRQKNNLLTQGSNSNKEIFVPLSIGIDNSGFNSRFIAGLRYQYNIALGDQIDGYSRSGNHNDIFSTITLSVKYKFGPVGIF